MKALLWIFMETSSIELYFLIIYLLILLLCTVFTMLCMYMYNLICTGRGRHSATDECASVIDNFVTHVTNSVGSSSA
jgi:hypothetical protein